MPQGGRTVFGLSQHPLADNGEPEQICQFRHGKEISFRVRYTSEVQSSRRRSGWRHSCVPGALRLAQARRRIAAVTPTSASGQDLWFLPTRVQYSAALS